MARTGVYLLLDPPGGEELPEVNIPYLPRRKQRQAKKDFWTTALEAAIERARFLLGEFLTV